MSVLLNKRVGVPLYVVVTDYDVHTQWIHRKAAGYFVGNDDVRVLMGRYGYPVERVQVTGIPVDPVFAGEGRRRPSGKPRILFMSGGLGMGHMEEALERLLGLKTPFDLTVVAGKNESLRKKLAKIAGSRAAVHGFVSDVPERMAASDLILTKAGGLTVSECLASKLPMLIFEPIPGQEECNTDYLVEHGAALKCRNLELLDWKVEELLRNPARLAKMRTACAAIARPWAGRDILRHVLGELARS
jgi:processive 1,2-diacylglycerol beta-glucosyltransferase